MYVFKSMTSIYGFSFSLALLGVSDRPLTLGQAVMHDFRFYEGGVSKRTKQAIDDVGGKGAGFQGAEN